MSTYISVKETATFLQCSIRTVYYLIEQQWLSAIEYPGKPTRVMLESAKTYLVYTCTTRDELKKYKRGRKKDKKEIGIPCKTDEANWLRDKERVRPRDTVGETALNAGNLIPPAEAAIQFQFSFGWMARILRPRDPALQDDLIQEMSLAVLECPQPANRKFFLDRAYARAINYLVYEHVRGRISLQEIHDRPDYSEAQRQSFEGELKALLKKGVKKEWIEAILDIELDFELDSESGAEAG